MPYSFSLKDEQCWNCMWPYFGFLKQPPYSPDIWCTPSSCSWKILINLPRQKNAILRIWCVKVCHKLTQFKHSCQDRFLASNKPAFPRSFPVFHQSDLSFSLLPKLLKMEPQHQHNINWSNLLSSHINEKESLDSILKESHPIIILK